MGRDPAAASRLRACRSRRSRGGWAWRGTRSGRRCGRRGRRCSSGRRRPSAVDAVEPQIRELLRGVSSDAGDGDRGADRLGSVADDLEGPGAGAAPVVRPAGSVSADRVSAGRAGPVGSVVPAGEDPVGPGAGSEPAGDRRGVGLLADDRGPDDPVRARPTTSWAGTSRACSISVGCPARASMTTRRRWCRGTTAGRTSPTRSSGSGGRSAWACSSASPATLKPKASSSGPTAIWRRASCPAGASSSPQDFNAQLACGCGGRTTGCTPRCVPAERPDRRGPRRDAGLAAGAARPGVAARPRRLGRDHWVRVGTCDYSVHPRAIGRRVDVRV